MEDYYMNSIKKYVSEMFTEYGKLIELENRTWRF